MGVDEVTSAVHHGSEFSFLIPLNKHWVTNSSESSPPATRSPISETQLIGEIRRAFSECGLTIDENDDCGYGSGQTDSSRDRAIVENRHFDRAWDRPVDIGRQAAVVNSATSLAVAASQSGRFGLWSSMPVGRPKMSSARSRFWRRDGQHGCNIIGGGLAYSDGPASIAVTVGGVFIGPTALRRDSARQKMEWRIRRSRGGALSYLAPSARTRAIRHSGIPIDEIEELVAHGGTPAWISQTAFSWILPNGSGQWCCIASRTKMHPDSRRIRNFFARDDDA